MKIILIISVFALFISCSNSKSNISQKWISLFDGKTFAGWKANENAGTFKIENGNIVVNGDRAHLFYDGPVMNHEFKDFEFEAEVMTTPGSNSGIFFHTAFQKEGWPGKGYEVQVNNSQSDWRRTGSLYDVQDVKETQVKDNVWFKEYIRVQGKQITIKINEQTVVDYIEPEGIEKISGRELKRLDRGTFALQGHDPKGKVYFKNIRVRPL